MQPTVVDCLAIGGWDKHPTMIGFWFMIFRRIQTADRVAVLWVLSSVGPNSDYNPNPN